jgi:hypothetical protein
VNDAANGAVNNATRLEMTEAPALGHRAGPGGQAAWRVSSGQSTMITESSLPNGLGS